MATDEKDVFSSHLISFLGLSACLVRQVIKLMQFLCWVVALLKFRQIWYDFFKLRFLPINQQTNSTLLKSVHFCFDLYWKYHNFERIDIRATVFLKWMDVVTCWLVFVRFLEESEDIKKRRFEINWPLVKFGQMSNFSKALKWMNFQVFHEGIDFFFQLWILPQLTCTPFSQHQNWWREKSKASWIALKVA